MVTPVTINHRDPGMVDEYGDHPLALVTSTDTKGYLWQSTRGEEDQIEHERWQLALKPDVDLDANDEVLVAGMTMEVLGNPWVVIDPVTTHATHIEATVLRRR